jgi:hypothetical protein
MIQFIKAQSMATWALLYFDKKQGPIEGTIVTAKEILSPDDIRRLILQLKQHYLNKEMEDEAFDTAYRTHSRGSFPCGA